MKTKPSASANFLRAFVIVGAMAGMINQQECGVLTKLFSSLLCILMVWTALHLMSSTKPGRVRDEDDVYTERSGESASPTAATCSTNFPKER